jgi:hypothetical protein
MTPKEKAEELYNKMLPKKGVVFKLYSKKCALLVVNEMIDNAGYIWGGRDTETAKSARDSYRDYWYEVKQELEKLEELKPEDEDKTFKQKSQWTKANKQL